MVDALLRAAHVQVTVAVSVISADNDLEVLRREFDRGFPGCEPIALAFNGNSIVREWRLEIVNDRMRSIGRGDAFRIFVGVDYLKSAAEGEDFGLVARNGGLGSCSRLNEFSLSWNTSLPGEILVCGNLESAAAAWAPW